MRTVSDLSSPIGTHSAGVVAQSPSVLPLPDNDYLDPALTTPRLKGPATRSRQQAEPSQYDLTIKLRVTLSDEFLLGQKKLPTGIKLRLHRLTAGFLGGRQTSLIMLLRTELRTYFKYMGQRSPFVIERVSMGKVAIAPKQYLTDDDDAEVPQ
ncbi:MAG TPA: hypothetical protein VK147_03735 [Candidatus Didemnitutus sp.]|nr:hypothetical protein [Candidatus Didemnitutus sp.]